MDEIIKLDMKEEVFSEPPFELSTIFIKEEIQDESSRTTLGSINADIQDKPSTTVEDKSSSINIKKEIEDEMELTNYECNFTDDSIHNCKTEVKEEIDDISHQDFGETKFGATISLSIDKTACPENFDKNVDTAQNDVAYKDYSNETCYNPVYKQLQEHMYQEKTQKKKMVTCGVCLAVISEKYFRNHIPLHSDVNASIFLCKYCGEKFTNKNDLDIHVDTIHYDEKNNICPVCQKRFNEYSCLKSHMKRHTVKQTIVQTREVKLHLCAACEKQFTTKKGFDRHMYGKHTQCICHYCEKKFNSLWVLRSHIRVHDKSNYTDHQHKYICCVCERKFNNISRLKKHATTCYKLEQLCSV